MMHEAKGETKAAAECRAAKRIATSKKRRRSAIPFLLRKPQFPSR
jgi:hypothetical protein